MVLFDLIPPEQDPDLARVAEAWLNADPDGRRAAAVFRRTFDQLYDGQRTGRYAWEQLFKTEKTHCGTLLEINLRREFDDIIDDGTLLDYRISGVDVDCKYSQTLGGWMIPPEALGQVLLVTTADDRAGRWNLGLVRARPEVLREGHNRDVKTSLTAGGREHIRWVARDAEMPPNVLLALPVATVEGIFALTSGQQRVNHLLRVATNRRIARTAIATVAQQDDFMKRVRSNGGARTALAPEGLLVIGGDYGDHRDVAQALGAVVPQPGEVVSVAVAPAATSGPGRAWIDGAWWRLRGAAESVTAPAPTLPRPQRASR